MEIIGIIVEWNPFHNGHKKHIQLIKDRYPESTLIAVTSGDVVQRGEFSIISKWDKTKIALENNVDLVLELPAWYTLNSANTFSDGAVRILNDFGVNKIIFGSESNDLDTLKEHSLIIQNTSDEQIKEMVKLTQSYPKAIEKIIGAKMLPNDILGLSYITSGSKINKNIVFETVMRKHDDTTQSASKIRESLLEGQDISKFYSEDVEIVNKRIFDRTFLSKLVVVDDNAPDAIKYLSNKFKGFDGNELSDFITESSNKSFTEARLKRELMKWYLGIKEEHRAIRILGMSVVGRKYLSNNEFDYTTNFDKDKANEEAIARVIDIVYPGTFSREIKNSPIIKE